MHPGCSASYRVAHAKGSRLSGLAAGAKPERVEVTARHRSLRHQCVNLLLRQAQRRDAGVTHIVSSIHHGPLVQAITPEVGGALARVTQHLPHLPQRFAFRTRQRVRRSTNHASVRLVKRRANRARGG